MKLIILIVAMLLVQSQTPAQGPSQKAPAQKTPAQKQAVQKGPAQKGRILGHRRAARGRILRRCR